DRLKDTGTNRPFASSTRASTPRSPSRCTTALATATGLKNTTTSPVRIRPAPPDQPSHANTLFYMALRHPCLRSTRWPRTGRVLSRLERRAGQLVPLGSGPQGADRDGGDAVRQLVEVPAGVQDEAVDEPVLQLVAEPCQVSGRVLAWACRGLDLDGDNPVAIDL